MRGRRVIIVIGITTIVTVNTSVVFYYSKNQIELPKPIARIIDSVSGFFEEQVVEVLPKNQKTNDAEVELDETHYGSDPTSKAKRHVRELHEVGTTCHVVKRSRSRKNIYQWVDDEGIPHVSDRPRLIDNTANVRVIGTIEPQLVVINYLDSQTSLSLKNKINAAVIKSQQFFEKVVPASLIKPVEINFRLFSDERKYEIHRQQKAPKLGPSLGFYKSSNNESSVMMHNEKQAVSTAIHEAMHSINRHWFGQMSKWMNEGIAEYAETDQSITSKKWLQEQRKSKLTSLQHLFNANKNDWNSEPSLMYQTSLYFIAYLMREETTLLSRLLLAENVNGCDTLSQKDVERISGTSTEKLQRSFNAWLTKH